MYETHWGLADKPFRNTPDPHYLYFSRQHEEALTRILYCILEGQGGVMVSGEVGCGKTLLSRILIDELSPEKFEVASLVHSSLDAIGLLREINRQFGIEDPAAGKSELLAYLGQCFRAHQKAGRQTVILIDEAQLAIDEETLEEMRLLLNFQQDRKFAVTLILLGQPELRESVKKSPQFVQRLNVRYHIGPLSREESLEYMRHRLAVAGGNHEIFTREAEELIAAASHGIPRRINGIADMALLAGFGQKAPLVDAELVRKAIADQQK